MSDILLSHQSAFKIRICRAYRLYLKQAKVSVEQWFQRELYFYTIFILTLVQSYQDYFMSTYKHIFFISCGKLALFESSVVHPLMNWCNFTLEYIDFISLWPLWPSFRSNSVCYFSLKYVFCQFHNNYFSPSDKVSVPLCYRYLSKTRIEKFIHDKLHQQPFVSLRNRSK